MEVKKPNSRASKAEIWEYTVNLEDQLKIYEDKLKSLQQNTSPNVQIKREEQENKKIKLQGFCINDLNNLEGEVKSFINNFLQNMDTLESIKDQIVIEADKLENIYKIKVEAETLYALIAARKEIIDNLTAKIKGLDEYYKTETEAREAELKSHLTQLELIAKYEREEEALKFDNEMKMKKLKLSQYENDLNEQKEELRDLQITVDSLNVRILEYDNAKRQEIEEAVEIAKKEFQKEQEYKIKLKESEYDKTIAILKCQKEMADRNAEELVVQLEQLQSLLKDSSDSMAQIASKTVDNYHMKNSLEDLKHIALTAANNNSNSKK